jgi:hypothetical protein
MMCWMPFDGVIARALNADACCRNFGLIRKGPQQRGQR